MTAFEKGFGVCGIVDEQRLLVDTAELMRAAVKTCGLICGRAGFIPVSGEEHLKNECNVLNVRKENIVSIERNFARRIACSEHFDGKVQLLDFSSEHNEPSQASFGKEPYLIAS